MNETPITPSEEPKKNRNPVIIGIVVAVLLCCCCVTSFGLWWLWNNGDALLGSVQHFIQM